MRTIIPILSLLCLITAGLCSASETVIIEAPSLIGVMTNLDGITGVIEIPADLGTLLGATLELTGQAEGGTLWCPDDTSHPWWVHPAALFENACIADVSGRFLAEFGAVEGEITQEVPVLWSPSQGGEAPWSCWDGAAVTVVLECVWGLPTNGCVPDPAPYFEITGARLLLEYEPTVSARTASWGAVKAVYR